MEVYEDCMVWTLRVGHNLIVVTAYARTIRAGDAVIERIEVTAHVL